MFSGKCGGMIGLFRSVALPETANCLLPGEKALVFFFCSAIIGTARFCYPLRYHLGKGDSMFRGV